MLVSGGPAVREQCDSKRLVWLVVEQGMQDMNLLLLGLPKSFLHLGDTRCRCLATLEAPVTIRAWAGCRRSGL